MKEKFLKFIKGLKNIDKSIFKVMNYGFIVSLFIEILGIITLLIYKFSYISYDLIEASILLFQTGLIFIVQILACGYTVDLVKKFNSSN